jgi:hypothetical protein
VKFLTDTAEPNCEKSKVDKVEPILAKDRNEQQDAMDTHCITDTLHTEPTFCKPMIEQAEPMRTNDLSENALPMNCASNTEMLLPRRVKLRRLKLEPTLK